jgi:hypothetical protein
VRRKQELRDSPVGRRSKKAELERQRYKARVFFKRKGRSEDTGNRQRLKPK